MASQRGDQQQASESLRQMFENVDIGVIEAVLEANGGEVDKSVDQLLEISAQVESSTHIHQKKQDNPEKEKPAENKWKNPLPEDFLSIEGLDIDKATPAEKGENVIAEAMRNPKFAKDMYRYQELKEYSEEVTKAGNEDDPHYYEKATEAFDKLNSAAQIRLSALATRFKRLIGNDGLGEYKPLPRSSDFIDEENLVSKHSLDTDNKTTRRRQTKAIQGSSLSETRESFATFSKKNT